MRGVQEIRSPVKGKRRLMLGGLSRRELVPVLVMMVAAIAIACSGPKRVGSSVEQGELFVPFGERLDYFVELSSGDALSISHIQLRHAKGGTLEVTVMPDLGTERSLGRVELSREANRWQASVSVSEPALCRVSIVASSTSGQGTGGVVISVPQVAGRDLANDDLRNALATEDEGELLARRSPLSQEPTAPRPNIIVYVIDTLRKDVVGAYGDEGGLTPHLDALAADGWTFEDAIAQSSWTRASIASVFTGLEPDLHGVNDRDDGLGGEAVTLAEELSTGGYRAAGVIANHNIGGEFGFGQGFSSYTMPRRTRRLDADLNRRLFRRLGWISTNQPFFLYVHSIGPHAPYEPPDEYLARLGSPEPDRELGEMDVLRSFRDRERVATAEERSDIEVLYRAETAFHDQKFGDFIARLKELSLYDSALIVVVSDHGEEFWEHENWGHGHTLYSEVLKVPLLMKPPFSKQPNRSKALVQHTDLFATVLDFAGLQAKHGVSLRAMANGSPARAANDRFGRVVFSSLDLDTRKGRSVTTRDWEYIVPESSHLGSAPMLFDRGADPNQLVNLAADRPVIAGYFSMLLAKRAEVTAPDLSEPTAIPADLEDKLKALGYLN